jgi:hypothetical protein
MGRKNNVHKLSPDARRYVERMLREDRWSLDEIVDATLMEFPDERLSRSSLHRYQPEFAELRERMDAIDRVSEALIGGLGEGAGDKAGALLAHAVTTAVTHAALKAQSSEEDISIAEIRKLAGAAKLALETRTLSMRERKAIAQEAREQQQREQADRLDQLGHAQGLSEEQANFLKRDVLGMK